MLWYLSWVHICSFGAFFKKQPDYCMFIPFAFSLQVFISFYCSPTNGDPLPGLLYVIRPWGVLPVGKRPAFLIHFNWYLGCRASLFFFGENLRLPILNGLGFTKAFFLFAPFQWCQALYCFHMNHSEALVRFSFFCFFLKICLFSPFFFLIKKIWCEAGWKCTFPMYPPIYV